MLWHFKQTQLTSAFKTPFEEDLQDGGGVDREITFLPTNT